MNSLLWMLISAAQWSFEKGNLKGYSLPWMQLLLFSIFKCKQWNTLYLGLLSNFSPSRTISLVLGEVQIERVHCMFIYCKSGKYEIIFFNFFFCYFLVQFFKALFRSIHTSDYFEEYIFADVQNSVSFFWSHCLKFFGFFCPEKFTLVKKIRKLLLHFKLFFDIIAERNKNLKFWDTHLLRLLSSFKQIFQPVSVFDDCRVLGPENLLTNEYLKIIIWYDKKQDNVPFSPLTFHIWFGSSSNNSW